MNRQNNITSAGCYEKLFLTDDTYKFLWSYNSESVKNDAYFSVGIYNGKINRRKRAVLRDVFDKP